MLDYNKFRGLSGYGKIKRLVGKLTKWHLNIENQADIYTPAEAKEKFGIESEAFTDLVAYLVYDGGALYSIMSNEFGHELSDRLMDTLDDCGLCCEPKNSWSMFIYLKQ